MEMLSNERVVAAQVEVQRSRSKYASGPTTANIVIQHRSRQNSAFPLSPLL